MIQREREALLERYLSGRMSLSEEEEFFIQAALDKELRLELKAHQTIDSAIMKDSGIPPSDYLILQTRVTEMLAASHEPLPVDKSIGNRGRTKSFFSRKASWLSVSLGTVTILAGMVIALMRGPQEHSERRTVPSITAPVQTVTTRPADRPSTDSAVVRDSIGSAKGGSGSNTRENQRSKDMTPSVLRQSQPRAAVVDSVLRSHEEKTVEPAVPMPTAKPQPDPPIRDADSVDIGAKARVNLPMR